jgi:hypothetical protein
MMSVGLATARCYRSGDALQTEGLSGSASHTFGNVAGPTPSVEARYPRAIASRAIPPGAPMTLTHKHLAGLALLCAGAVTPALAESFASSASSAGSASLGSLSDSVKGSSRSSSGETKTADGDYRVIEVAEAADRPGMLTLRLQATAVPGEEGTLLLTLPRQALEPRGIAAGDVIHAQNRPYGIAFARAIGTRTREAFFLVLADAWHRELDPQPVKL